MTNTMSPLSRRWVWPVALCVVGISCARPESAAGQRFIKFPFSGKTVKYQTYRDPAGRFELQYPKKDWRLLPHGASLAVFFPTDDSGANVAIDYLRLARALAPSEIGRMAQIEVQDLKERHPQATAFTVGIMESNVGPWVMIRFDTTGSKGPERVLQYSIPSGENLYRVIATAPESSLTKYETLLMHMLASFKPLSLETATKD